MYECTVVLLPSNKKGESVFPLLLGLKKMNPKFQYFNTVSILFYFHAIPMLQYNYLFFSLCIVLFSHSNNHFNAISILIVLNKHRNILFFISHTVSYYFTSLFLRPLYQSPFLSFK